jgi:hypothetical protein
MSYLAYENVLLMVINVFWLIVMIKECDIISLGSVKKNRCFGWCKLGFDLWDHVQVISDFETIFLIFNNS